MTDALGIMDEDSLRAFLASAQKSISGRLSNPVDATDYDFLRPHRFTPDQVRRLDDFIELAARNITASLSAVLRGAFGVRLRDFTEEYADCLRIEGTYYSIPIQSGGQVRGYLVLPVATGIAWVTKLLGGMVDGEIDEKHKLSTLESDLILDVSLKVMEAFSVASTELGGPAFERDASVGQVPLDLKEENEIIEYCRLTFELSGAERELDFTFLLLSDVLEGIAGLVRPEKQTEQAIREEMLGHVESVRMNVTARLDFAEVAMRYIAGLEVGDVVLLHRKVGEPLEVIMSDKKVMVGLPVQCKGMYGIKIQDMVASF